MLAANGECRLLGGAFASFIQVCLASLCITTLAFKRYGEIPQRPWIVWALDVGKQSVGSSFGHFSNIFLSEIIAKAVTGGDECQWYCLSFLLDSTLGTFVNLSLLHFVESIIRTRSELRYLQFGDYGDPPSLSRWASQLVIWLAIVIMGKVICVSLLLEFSITLDIAISYLFQNLRSRPQVELIVVMIIVPGIFNVISFWITDTFLKQHGHSHEQIPQTDLDEDLLEMRIVNGDAESGSLQGIVGSTSSKASQSCINPIMVTRNKTNSTSSLLSSSPTETSPISTQSLWQNATGKIPEYFGYFSSRIGGTTASKGFGSKASETDLVSLTKPDSDDSL